MSTVDTSATPTPKPTPAPKPAGSCGCQTGVFVYDLAVVLILVIIGVFYARHPEHFKLADPRMDIAVRAAWFGAMGGLVISLKGVYDHCCQRGDWDDCFNLWHIGRPVSGALTGMVTLLLLLVAAPDGKGVSEPAVYTVAFIFGTQERRFFNFLSEIAALVVRVPNEDQKTALKGVDIQPSEGKAGDLALITGQGFAKDAKVTIGTNALVDPIVAKNGSSIVGKVPAGSGAVEVVVTNPSGAHTTLPTKFTYKS